MSDKVNSSALDLMNDGVKTFVILDFDGVINIFPKVREDFFKTAKNRITQGYHLMWDPFVIEKLNSILDDDSVQLVWLTTWREGIIPVQDELLGLNPKRPAVVIPWTQKFSDYDGVWGKSNGLNDWLDGVNGTARAVWADDVVTRPVFSNIQSDCYRFENSEIVEDGSFWITLSDHFEDEGFVGIFPDEHVGLTFPDLEMIEDFLKT